MKRLCLRRGSRPVHTAYRCTSPFPWGETAAPGTALETTRRAPCWPPSPALYGTEGPLPKPTAASMCCCPQHHTPVNLRKNHECGDVKGNTISLRSQYGKNLLKPSAPSPGSPSNAAPGKQIKDAGSPASGTTGDKGDETAGPLATPRPSILVHPAAWTQTFVIFF